MSKAPSPALCAGQETALTKAASCSTCVLLKRPDMRELMVKALPTQEPNKTIPYL
jgi:hypothetical protein